MSTQDKKPSSHDSRSDDSTFEALREAYDPGPLDLELNERLIAAALAPQAVGEQATSTSSKARPDATSSVQEELEQAELLARALLGQGTHPLAELASTLLNAYAPAPLSIPSGRTIANRVLEPRRSFNVVVLPTLRRYAALTLGLAAGIALWFQVSANSESRSTRSGQVQFVQSRSVAPLFAETLSHGTATERIDRIYAVRSRELRQNRYAAWRVQ